ncbi:hypothetical protein ACI8AA_01505 [Geodermatophilus sp. SYSU D01180]
MAKTRIETVENNRNTAIEYQNLENSGCNRSVPANRSRSVGCDVPWVDNEDQFRTKHLEIQDSSGRVIAHIWQRTVGGEDLVRTSRTGWDDPGSAIGGNAVAGGKKRNLVVDDNGVRLDDLE